MGTTRSPLALGARTASHCHSSSRALAAHYLLQSTNFLAVASENVAYGFNTLHDWRLRA